MFEEKSKFRRSALLLGSFFGVSIFLRLAFITRVFVPPYFDSVEHYRIVQGIATALDESNVLKVLPTLVPSYYHLGFHFIASLLTLSLRANPIDVILVLGQVMLAAIPIPLFLLIRQETHSDIAALFSALLAGFGWYMPGFAINWGKYPAMSGLLVLGIVLSVAYNLCKRSSGHRVRMALAGLIILCSIASMFFHTRTLAIIAISVMSWFAAGKIQILSKPYRYTWLGILLAVILVFGRLILKEPLLSMALDPYLRKGAAITLMVLFLSPFALIEFPRGTYFSLLFVLGVFVALFIPVDIHFPGFENQTVLDRPFAEMVLYLPLSFLGGLGLAGLLQRLYRIRFFPQKTRLCTRTSVAVLLIGFASCIAAANYDFYPSDCCNLVAYDDTVAIDWMNRNLPSNSHILVAATQLNVLPSVSNENLVGTDAGIWIPALSDQRISLMSFDTDFRSADTLERLCKRRIKYVYVGGTAQKFDAKQLQEKADWYDRILSLPNTQLYELKGCSR